MECLWSAEDGEAAESGAIESVMPDGCPEWIFDFGAPYRRLEPGGPGRAQPASLLVGALARPLALAATGPVHTMGVRFRPGLGVFPSRILYWLSEDGALHARVEGTQKGKPSAEEWTWVAPGVSP